MLRILLVEENLRSRKGHWFQFAHSLRLAERDAGLRVEVAGGRKADSDVLSVLGAARVFSGSRLDKRGMSRLPGLRNLVFLWHNWVFYRELLAFLRANGTFDVVFFPTASHYHLFAIWLLQRFHRKHLPRAAVFFVQQPTSWPLGAEGPRPDKIAGLLRFQLARFRELQSSRRTVFAVETARAQREFRDLAGIDVELWPHPVAVAKARFRNTTNHPVVFGSLGFARHEKGSDIIASALKLILEDDRFADCRFVIQWGANFRMPDGSIATLPDSIRCDPRVKVIDKALEEVAYLEEISSLSALLLPYRRNSYYGRLSRISIEAAAAGIPMIATPGTHLEDVVRHQGAGIVMRDESAGALVDSIALFLTRADELRNIAIQRAPSTAAANSARRFLDVLCASFQ